MGISIVIWWSNSPRPKKRKDYPLSFIFYFPSPPWHLNTYLKWRITTIFFVDLRRTIEATSPLMTTVGVRVVDDAVSDRGGEKAAVEKLKRLVHFFLLFTMRLVQFYCGWSSTLSNGGELIDGIEERVEACLCTAVWLNLLGSYHIFGVSFNPHVN